MKVLSIFIAFLAICSVSLASKKNIKDLSSIFDITDGGFPGVTFDIVHETIKLPAVRWGYTLNQTANVQGNKLSVPDELFYTPTSRAEFDKSFKIIKSTSQFFESYVKHSSIGLSVSIYGVNLGGAFSNTKGQITNILQDGKYNFACVNNEIDTFKLSLFPVDDSNLSPQFAVAVQKLPAVDDGKAYRKFIDFWGTHIITGAQYGGKSNFTTAFSANLFDKHTQTWVDNEISFSIGYAMFNLNFNFGMAKNKSSVDTEFTSASNTTHEVIGGDATVFETDGYEAWLKTIPTRQALIMLKSSLAPISELISDVQKQKQMVSAIISYANDVKWVNFYNKK